MFTLCVLADIRFVNLPRSAFANTSQEAPDSDVDVLVGRTGVYKFDNQRVGGTGSGRRRLSHRHKLTETLLANGQLPESLCTDGVATKPSADPSTSFWLRYYPMRFGPRSQATSVEPGPGSTPGSSRSSPEAVRGRAPSQRAARTSDYHPALSPRHRLRAPRVR